MQEWIVRVGGAATTAIYDDAEGGPVEVLVCGHGAGGHLNDRGVLAAAAALRAAGLGVVRFNFLYKERKSARPDPMPRLMETVAAVADHTRRELGAGRLFLGGRSMGGRAASMLAADGYDTDGLILLAYPLHPPGRSDKVRDAHLPNIRQPVLCFNGTRDDFCERRLMETVLRRVPRTWTMRWLEGADHGFHLLKKSGRTDTDVMAEVTDATRDWLGRHRFRTVSTA